MSSYSYTLSVPLEPQKIYDALLNAARQYSEVRAGKLVKKAPQYQPHQFDDDKGRDNHIDYRCEGSWHTNTGTFRLYRDPDPARTIVHFEGQVEGSMVPAKWSGSNQRGRFIEAMRDFGRVSVETILTAQIPDDVGTPSRCEGLGGLN